MKAERATVVAGAGAGCSAGVVLAVSQESEDRTGASTKSGWGAGRPARARLTVVYRLRRLGKEEG